MYRPIDRANVSALIYRRAYCFGVGTQRRSTAQDAPASNNRFSPFFGTQKTWSSSNGRSEQNCMTSSRLFSESYTGQTVKNSSIKSNSNTIESSILLKRLPGGGGKAG